MLRFLFKIIGFVPFTLLFWTSVSGRKYLRQFKGKPVVIVSNHKSMKDPAAMFFRVHRSFGAIGKDYLFKIPLVGWILRRAGVFPVGVGLSAVKTSLRVLKKRRALLVYPEGTRVSDPGDALALRNGASMIAIKAGVPVLPCVINRAPRIFRLSRIKFGEPISVEEYQDRKIGKDELTEFSNKVSDVMTQMLEGFEVKEKRKRWEQRKVDTARAIMFREIRIPDVEGGGAKQQILLMRRTKPHINKGREYFVTAGGHLDEGESVKQAVVREVREESGLEARAIRTLYKQVFNKKMHAFVLCEYVSGEVFKDETSEEYQPGIPQSIGRDGKPRGTYDPMWVDLGRLSEKDFVLKPKALLKQLLGDIKKRGTKLVRNVKLLK
ncbi:MAG: 1-acyl-sn-glycerol-3-phosphate acyltransferase [Firmicutes bacterium]|nr:1-acyl-sn-glycerol-3-phosphate acyltransferase [Bacillota bacterium]